MGGAVVEAWKNKWGKQVKRRREAAAEATVARSRPVKRKPAARPSSPNKTMMRWDLINELLPKDGRYLEIGVAHGVCGSKVKAKRKVGVDPRPMKGGPAKFHAFHEMSSDEFFEQTDERFDVILIDGLHHHEQVLRDVDGALSRLEDGGTIVLHDCNPQSELAQRVPRETRHWNGDCWKAIAHLRAHRRELETFVIDADEGLGVVRPIDEAGIRKTVGSRFDSRDVIVLHRPTSELSYDDLERNRQSLLGLRPAAYWRCPVVNVLTVALGPYGTVAPAPPMEGHEFFAFVSNGRDAPGWRHLAAKAAERWTSADGSGRERARRTKARCVELVPPGDVVIWVDASIRIEADLRRMAHEALAHADIAAFAHPNRNCIYDEGRECIRLGKCEPSRMNRQLFTYEQQGIQRQGGLWDTSVLVRRRTPAMVELGRLWEKELLTHTLRDQVSLPYVLQRLGVSMATLPGKRLANSYVSWRGRHGVSWT